LGRAICCAELGRWCFETAGRAADISRADVRRRIATLIRIDKCFHIAQKRKQQPYH
jgi:hypothetical protein